MISPTEKPDLSALLLSAAEAAPERTALISGGSPISYAGLLEQVRRAAEALRTLNQPRFGFALEDHSLQLTGLLACELAGVPLMPRGEGPGLEDSMLQGAIQAAGPMEPSPLCLAPEAPIFFNFLSYAQPFPREWELRPALSAAGCLCFSEGERGFLGELPRFRPTDLVLDRRGLELLRESIEAAGPGGSGCDRLRRIVCRDPLTPRQREFFSALGLSLIAP